MESVGSFVSSFNGIYSSAPKYLFRKLALNLYGHADLFGPFALNVSKGVS
jgi:hypothetical protein